MSKAKFSKHLKELGIEEMRHELIDLYDKVPEVRQYYAMELGSDKDRAKIFARAKKNIESKYATKSYRRPRRPRIQKINAILRNMKKASIFNHELADLYLFDIETALVFSLKYHFYSTTLGNHLNTVFKNATELIDQEQVHDLYKERCKAIKERSIFIPELHLMLRDSYNSCFEK